MKRIDSSGATVDKHFTEGNPSVPTAATVVSADYLNILMEEICSLIEYAGLTLDQSHTYDGVPAHDCTQLRQAVKALLNGGSGGVTTVTFVMSPYTAVVTKKIIPVDTSGGNVVINLPAKAGVPGEIWEVSKITGDANTVTVDGNSTDTINGELTQVIDQQWTCLRFRCLGANHWVIA